MFDVFSHLWQDPVIHLFSLSFFLLKHPPEQQNSLDNKFFSSRLLILYRIFGRKFPNSFMIWEDILLKRTEEIAIITSTINEHVHFEILDDVLISTIHKWFGDNKVFLLKMNIVPPCLNELKLIFMKGM